MNKSTKLELEQRRVTSFQPSLEKEKSRSNSPLAVVEKIEEELLNQQMKE